MTDPDITLTDFALAALCAGLAAASLPVPMAGVIFAGLFAALGLAALAGGFWHGWYAGKLRGGVGGALWLMTLLAVGLANLCLWLIAGELFWSVRSVLSAIAIGQFALYALAAIFLTQGFALASAFSLPPSLTVLAGYTVALAAGGPSGLWAGVGGVSVALVGAGMQAAKLGLPRLGLSHNALYHIVQGLAVTLVFLSLPAVAALHANG